MTRILEEEETVKAPVMVDEEEGARALTPHGETLEEQDTMQVAGEIGNLSTIRRMKSHRP